MKQLPSNMGYSYTLRDLTYDRVKLSFSERWNDQNSRIKLYNDKYHAYITVFEKPLAVKGFLRKTLKGAIIAVKDIFHIEGYPTTAGSKLFNGKISKTTAYAVKRILQSGGVVNGKTNLHEFAFGVSNRNPHYGDCLNPFDAGRVSGGSSGGSAVAVALGMCDAALGTDTAGSVRIPASFCGLVGFKPSQDLVSTEGTIPLSWSLDHVGVICRTVWDAAFLTSVLSDSFKKPLSIKPAALEGLKIGVPANFFLDYLDDDVRRNFEKSIDKAGSGGCDVVKVVVEKPETAARCRFIIVHSEAAAHHLKLCSGKMDLYGDEVRQRIASGLAIPASVYLNALRARKILRDRFRKIFKQCDVLAVPTTIIPAHRLEEEHVDVGGKLFDVRTATLRNTELFNVYGVPAVSIPNGFTKNGLPTGLQLIGDIFEDIKLLRITYAFERLLSS
ncbi:MAG: amidase [Candidatus Caldarchaeum sp.]